MPSAPSARAEVAINTAGSLAYVLGLALGSPHGLGLKHNHTHTQTDWSASVSVLTSTKAGFDIFKDFERVGPGCRLKQQAQCHLLEVVTALPNLNQNLSILPLCHMAKAQNSFLHAPTPTFSHHVCLRQGGSTGETKNQGRDPWTTLGTRESSHREGQHHVQPRHPQGRGLQLLLHYYSNQTPSACLPACLPHTHTPF